MELELCLPPEDAGRLTRLRWLSTSLRGRPRVRRQSLVWHDTPDRRLADAGLALVQEGRVWRLERLLPGDSAWPPGQPPPVLERTADPASFEHVLPEPLAPVASFTGRISSYALETEDGPLVLGVLRGQLRSVAQECPVFRILLAGPETPLRRLALAMAEELFLAIPTACLAGEALALATGVPPPPRRHGASQLPPGLGVAEAFAWAVAHLTDAMLYFAAELDAQSGPEVVHQMRVAVRRLRSCLSVFDPAVACDLVQQVDAMLKGLGQRLAPARDWDVFLGETASAVLAMLPDDPRLRRMLRAAARRKQAHYAELRAYLEGGEFRRLSIELSWLTAAASWLAALPTQEILHGDLRPFADAAQHRLLRKLLTAGEAIEELAPAALHQLRLRAKRMRYGAEIFAPIYPGKAPRRFIRRLSAVQQALGELNDSAVASALMTELGGPGGRHAYAVGLLQGFAAARAALGRERAVRTWNKFLRHEPFWE